MEVFVVDMIYVVFSDYTLAQVVLRFLGDLDNCIKI